VSGRGIEIVLQDLGRAGVDSAKAVDLYDKDCVLGVLSVDPDDCDFFQSNP